MAILSGRDATIKVGTYVVAEQASWAMPGMTTDVLDLPVFGKNFKRKEFGVGDYGQIVCTGYYDITDTTGQMLLKSAWENKSDLDNLYIYVDDTSYWRSKLEPTNLVANGTFADNSAWVNDSGWAIGPNGQGEIASTLGAVSGPIMHQVVNLETGAWYEVTFTITSFGVGLGVYVRLGDANAGSYDPTKTNIGTIRAEAGTFTEVIQCKKSTDTNVYFLGVADGETNPVLSIDNVTVKRKYMILIETCNLAVDYADVGRIDFTAQVSGEMELV